MSYKTEVEKSWNIAGIVLGALMSIAGLVITCIYPGSPGNVYIDYVRYGADFYTDISRTIQNINKHSIELVRNVKVASVALGLGLMFLGILVIICFGKKLALAIATEKDETHSKAHKNAKAAHSPARSAAAEKKAHQAAINAEMASLKVKAKKVAFSVSPMNKPDDFRYKDAWKEEIKELDSDEINERYCDTERWNESYRYLCYLELKERGF